MARLRSAGRGLVVAFCRLVDLAAMPMVHASLESSLNTGTPCSRFSQSAAAERGVAEVVPLPPS
jgi:hypothetical protein